MTKNFNEWSVSFNKPIDKKDKLKKKAKFLSIYNRKVGVLKKFYYHWDIVKEITPITEFFHEYEKCLCDERKKLNLLS